jgi:hypothetical protein
VAAKAIGADISSWEKNLNLDILSAVNSIEAALPMFHGLRVVYQSVLMSFGLYNEPEGAFLPSVQ